jgi:hypothetical protein
MVPLGLVLVWFGYVKYSNLKNEREKMNIKDRCKAQILAALYNNSKPLGMGFLHYKEEIMTTEEAEKLLKNYSYFDYLHGRVMKIDLSGDELSTDLYNRDNGEGSAEKIINSL